MHDKNCHMKALIVGWWSKPTLVTGRKTVLLAMGIVMALAMVFWGITVHANAAISQSYRSDERIAIGSIISLKEDSTEEVEPAFTGNVDNIFGIAINDNSSLIQLRTTNDNRVQVATSGTFGVLVSDINGSIERGDHITASPIPGVGMKATANTKVVGVAQGRLVPDQGRVETYIDENDREQSVLLGEVPVLVNVAHYFREPEKTIIPPAVQSIANAIANRAVEPLPIIISAVIFIVTMVVVASIIFSMIRNSIISVGRNPMSQAAIYRDLTQMSALVVAILAVAVMSIYMVLTRF
jgi:hypothetical protein